MDLHISETGNGGDLQMKGNDICVIFGLENMPYLGIFGGNIEGSTTGPKVENQQSNDWWGNNLLMPNNPSIQFNSTAEKMLQEVALNSSGRVKIEQALKKDLEFMSDFADILISSSITATDKLEIALKVNEPKNLQAKEFAYIWEQTETDDDSACTVIPTLGDFNIDFNIDFN